MISLTHGWGFDDNQLEIFRKALIRWGKDWEKEGTAVMHKYSPKVKDSFRKAIPTSRADGKEVARRGFAHANSIDNSLQNVDFHMGFRVRTTGSRTGIKHKGNAYGYLIFPNEGRGNRNPVKQDFTGRAMKENEKPLLKELDTTIVDLYLRSVK